MGIRTRKHSEPKGKFRKHEKLVVLRLEIGTDLLREPQAGDIVAALAKRKIEEFKVREGLDGRQGNGRDEANASSD